MAKADWNRTFIGTITRFTNEDGSKFVTGEVFVEDGDIWSMADNNMELARNLDGICQLKLDYGIHTDTGRTEDIYGDLFFLN